MLRGDRDERPDTATIISDYGARSLQRSTRHRMPVMPPERIRTLPSGTGPELLRQRPTDRHGAAALDHSIPAQAAPFPTMTRGPS